MEFPPSIYAFDQTYTRLCSSIYVNGDSVIKLPINGAFYEFKRWRLFHEIAPQYSPGPFALLKTSQFSGVSMQHAGEPVHMSTDKLERTMGFLQTIHCVMLIDGRLGLFDMRAWHLLKTGIGADVRFRFVHVGSWIMMKDEASSRDGMWRSNAREIERIWNEIGIREFDTENSVHEFMQRLFYDDASQATAAEVAKDFVACAEFAVQDYVKQHGVVPVQMAALLEEIAGCV